MSERGEEYVRRLTVARLATVGRDGRPHCVPVCFAADGDRVLVMTPPESKKARNVRASGVAAVAVDDGQAVQGVMIEGPARIIEDGEPFLEAQEVMLRAGALSRRREPREQIVIEVTRERWVEWGFDGA
jgi:PPOX class probable F420-dependent enzyme